MTGKPILTLTETKASFANMASNGARAAIGHMPFPGSRTVEEVWKQERIAAKAKLRTDLVKSVEMSDE